MEIVFLGTGTSHGVPMIGCNCDVCTSLNPKDTRYRSSVLVNEDNVSLVVDCGMDFRSQMLREKVTHIDAVLLTHEHQDHTGGIDDTRVFSMRTKTSLPLYAEKYVLTRIKEAYPYIFAEKRFPGLPDLALNEIDTEVFSVKGVEVIPIRVMHYKLPVLGFRVGGFAYLTDLNYIPEGEYSKLENLDVLVIDALRIETHFSHFNLEQALSEIERIAPKKAYLTHISHQLGLYEVVEKNLPENVYLAYDGLRINL